jgi:hypothetical protein
MGWTLADPVRRWFTMPMTSPAPNPLFPQADSYSKTTQNRQLVREYFGHRGRFTDPLLTRGAAYLFLSIPITWLPKGEETIVLERAEDAVSAALKARRQGVVIGRGLGLHRAYLDLMVVDGERSIETILEAAHAGGLPKETELRFFDENNRQLIYHNT